MAARCRHPRVVALSCRLYGLVICLYPADLRRDYDRELRLAFRNCLEDVVNTGRLRAVLCFAGHIAADWLRTLVLEPEPTDTASLLGLTSTDRGAGCVDRSTVTVSLMLASLGVVMLIAGWYWWLHYTAAILSHHQSLLASLK